jgi:hypothetical protein
MTDIHSPFEELSPEDQNAHTVFDALETSLKIIGSPEADAVVDALVALSMDDERAVAAAIVAAIGLNRPVDDSVGDQTGARASSLRPLDLAGPPGSPERDPDAEG